MTDSVLTAIRALGGSLSGAIIGAVTLDKRARLVTVKVITDKSFTDGELAAANTAVRAFVPAYFDCKAEISKLVPDEELVARAIRDELSRDFPAVFATLGEGDVAVEKSDAGFNYKIYVNRTLRAEDIVGKINHALQKKFCGNFTGECLSSDREIEIDCNQSRPDDDIEFEIPARRFPIENFELLEGTEKHKSAVYLADLNFVGENVVVCGVIEEIREKQYTNKKGAEKSLLSITLNDGTATAYVTYFIRMRTEEKIRALKVGDSIVCTGKNEEWRGNLRFTANYIDKGSAPKGFVPEKRPSKPVPMRYKKVFPQPFVDMRQADFFSQTAVPECLKGKNFVVCDLETTGLNSSPVSGNMDKIIEIGAFKVVDGIIKESFTTFINPRIKLSEEIINLTGITEEMIENAPTYEEVMPDFYKFCDGCVLVGHNISGFDFKFLEYYCARLGYILERRLIDTVQLSQQLLFLSNYKLNTVADKFGVEFNHHRAIDDALATAKIFIELIKIKKCLPEAD